MRGPHLLTSPQKTPPNRPRFQLKTMHNNCNIDNKGTCTRPLKKCSQILPRLTSGRSTGPCTCTRPKKQCSQTLLRLTSGRRSVISDNDVDNDARLTQTVARATRRNASVTHGTHLRTSPTVRTAALHPTVLLQELRCELVRHLQFVVEELGEALDDSNRRPLLDQFPDFRRHPDRAQQLQRRSPRQRDIRREPAGLFTDAIWEDPMEDEAVMRRDALHREEGASSSGRKRYLPAVAFEVVCVPVAVLDLDLPSSRFRADRGSQRLD